MLIKHHEPYGTKENQQNPLPKNWRELAAKTGIKPKRFGIVEEGKLYRSGIIWPPQIPWLQENHGIVHIVSLLEGDWLQDYYESSDIVLHQFPFRQRRQLTFDRAKNIVDVINDLEKPAIVHCLHGVVRTGMVCAAYQIINGRKSHYSAILETVMYGNINLSALKEISSYTGFRF